MTEATRTGRKPPSAVEQNEAWLSADVVIPASRCGPPGIGNGGWVAGTVAGHLGSGPVEVTLHAPTPVDTSLRLRVGEARASLSHGDQVLVTARRVTGHLRAPEPVTRAQALAAEAGYPGHHEHPFPECFVCSPVRALDDGMRVFPGPVEGRPGTVAAAVTVLPAHAGADGRLGPAGVWAVLDCPSAWVDFGPGKEALLGRLAAQVRGQVRVGENYVVVAELAGVEGRKMRSRVALFDSRGREVAVGVATWIRRAGRRPG